MMWLHYPRIKGSGTLIDNNQRQNQVVRFIDPMIDQDAFGNQWT